MLKMKQNEIQSEGVDRLSSSNLANMFNVYEEDGRYFYNLLSSIYIPTDLNKTLYRLELPKGKEYLTTFSYRMYKTVDLAWLIAVTNRIDNMLAPLKPDVPIRVLNDNVVRDILLKLKVM